MADNTIDGLNPVELCERNARLLGKQDIVVAGDPGCGAALVSNIVFELGFDYLDPYTEVVDGNGSARPAQDRLAYYRERLPATAAKAKAGAAGAGAGYTADSRRFVKTHLYPHHFCDVELGGAVLLVRDPRDSIYSAYKWFGGFSASYWPGASDAGAKTTFARFLDRRRTGDGETPILGWARFCESWLAAGPGFDRFAVVRFEDLKTNAVGTITAMLAALGLDVPLDVIVRAAERSSFDAMRAREEEASGAEGDTSASTARIMRRGKVGEWAEWWSQELADRFSDTELRMTAARFGYDLT